MSGTPIPVPGRTLIFDYGEVISLTPTEADRSVLLGLAGDVEPEAFWAAYWRHRDGLDQGADGVAAYWTAIAEEIGARWDAARIHQLWAADFRSWLSINPEVIGVLADLRAGGTRLALLSNAGPDFGSYFRHGPLADLFDAFFVSGELNLLKPHADIYRHVLAELGIAPAEAVFVDNKAENVRGAEELGIAGHVFTSAPALRTFLASLTDQRVNG